MQAVRPDARLSGKVLAMTQRTKGVGTPMWMAPEVLAGERYGPSADVYSYGIVLWEIAAHSIPWSDLPDGPFFLNQLRAKIEAGERPAVDPTWPRDYVALMRACWAGPPHDRPQFKDIARQLETL